MKKLLKSYNLSSNMEYYQMVVDSFVNGQRVQAWQQFRAMPRENRVEFLKEATISDWETGLEDSILKQLFDLAI